MTTWFSADTHYGHKNSIEYANRPFSSVEEMDEVMIRNHNERVKPGDRFIHVGDFAFVDHDPYLARLNGQKFLVPGNHDHSNRIKKAKGWHEVLDKLTHLKLPCGTELGHYAMRVWRNSHHGAIHLYGHSHGNLIGDSQSCDVGVDCWRFAPVSIEDIKAHLSCFRDRRQPDHHQPRKEENATI